jgi:primosomal protein N' (replication factor Y) (superfamily II helicase)
VRIAKVEPILTTRALRGPFDYRLPESAPELEPGALLIVPFAGRELLGVLVGLADHSELPEERLAAPLELLEASTAPELIELGRWVAERYCSTPARGIALALPPGAGAGKRPRGARPRRERHARITAAGREALNGGGGGPRLGSRQRETLAVLAAGEEVAASALAAQGGSSAVLSRLAERGLVELRDLEVRRVPSASAVNPASGPIRLSATQQGCAERIGSAVEAGRREELLLFGVTGSGKTEVYLDAIERALARRRGAILLVPEIGLTPQTVGRVRARLGERVALLHSALSEGERYDEWRRLRAGEADVCVGPRSAVFAPVRELGLLIVDEEHDTSYKQEGDPRYDARAVARRRCELAGAVYLAGTATPRPESWAELERCELPERVDGLALPPVELLDMREVSPRGGPLHPRTRAALGGLGEGEKAIVMLNRRGFSPHLSCGSCGTAVGCPDCDVSLVLHRGAGRLVCHHCGHVEAVPGACPACGSAALARYGAGTERIEGIVAELAAPAPVFRLDADTAARKGAPARLLADFGAAAGGVLVGTQMVAKGHDFSDVVLSVLLDADSTLRYPDFRAEERTFALVSQLAGRSGRGQRGGRVLVQTLAPEAAPIAAAARHDAPGFLAGELERRRDFGYPPYATLIAVELAGPAEPPLAAAAERIAAAIEPGLPAGSELLGPAPRFRRRGRYRRRLLIKTGAGERAAAAVQEAVDAAVGSGELAGINLAVDVDPQ